MNFKLILLAVVFYAFLVDATPRSKSRSNHRRKHQKKSHEVTNTPVPKTTTTTTTTTTVKPNSSICKFLYKVNTTSGAYLKSLCHFQLGYTTPQALDYCKANGMALYKLTDADSVKGLETFLDMTYHDPGIDSFLIDGYRNSTNWVLYSDLSVPVYSGVVWDTNSVNTVPLPQCFVYNLYPTRNFLAQAYPCSKTSYFSCEFY